MQRNQQMGLVFEIVKRYILPAFEGVSWFVVLHERRYYVEHPVMISNSTGPNAARTSRDGSQVRYLFGSRQNIP